jgi:xanthosine utilization system XapX-like protein
MKLLYKPFGIVLGIMAGLVGRRIFDLIWEHIDEEDAPKPTTQHSPLAKVMGAAAIQGAVFRVTRAAVDRAGANGFQHLTGVWPGEKVPDRD